MARRHGAALTAAQVAAFLAYCRRDLADQTPHQRATATVLVMTLCWLLSSSVPFLGTQGAIRQ